MIDVQKDLAETEGKGNKVHRSEGLLQGNIMYLKNTWSLSMSLYSFTSL